MLLLGTVQRWRRRRPASRARADRRGVRRGPRRPRPGRRTSSSSRCSRSCGRSTARTSRRGSTSRRLPTEGERVLVGPGENAGVIDAGDGIAIAVRIESHNHPSAIEPHQGAATGVGGILRDIFTMGARPAVRHGPPVLRRARPPAPALALRGRRRAASRATATRSASQRSAASSPSTPATRATRSSTSCAWARCRSTGSCSGERAASGTWPCCSASATGRDGIGGVSVLASAGFGSGARRRRQAPERPGRGPLRGEAAHRGLPRAARPRLGRRDPGPRRARGSPARRARPRRAPGSAWTSTSPRCRAASRAWSPPR